MIWVSLRPGARLRDRAAQRGRGGRIAGGHLRVDRGDQFGGCPRQRGDWGRGCRVLRDVTAGDVRANAGLGGLACAEIFAIWAWGTVGGARLRAEVILVFRAAADGQTRPVVLI